MSQGVRVHEEALWARLRKGLATCARDEFPLPGAANAAQREVFLRQMVDSVRRVEYVDAIAKRPIHPERADGLSPLFDPLRAAVLKSNAGDFDEACWLVFLFVHFGKHPVAGYRYTREVYSALGQREPWTFKAVAANPGAVRAWLDANKDELSRGRDRGFGNHRKYLSLSGTRRNGTGHAFETYVQWVCGRGNHLNLFATAFEEAGRNKEVAFERLFQSMAAVASFGRIGKFDYLTMIQKLGFAKIRPGRPYFDSQTKGPNTGARAMFQVAQHLSIAELEGRTKVLGAHLGVGMQEMEDALCNWGKNPHRYTYFRG